jgi:diguanylate cyclase (GGDEF)-like protein
VTTAVFVDVDQFKEVNDTYGHHVGDAVLVTVAERLRTCSRGDDVVARVGGDEFVVVAPGVAAGTAEALGQRILDAMRQPVVVENITVEVSTSVGISVGDTHDIAVRDLIRQADEAMYTAKVAGKNRMATHPAALKPRAKSSRR